MSVKSFVSGRTPASESLSALISTITRIFLPPCIRAGRPAVLAGLTLALLSRRVRVLEIDIRARADKKMSQELRGRILSIVLILGGLAPSVALATVGFAETHSRLAYNDLAELDWVHPGDGCNVGKTCFFLE